MASVTRVIVVDDHALFRQVVRQAFAQHPSIQVVGEAADAEEALPLVRRLQPNIVLMDLGLPGMDGVEATRRLRADLPGVEILVVTASEDQADLVAALHAGAKGYLLKTTDFQQLVRSVEALSVGQGFLSPRATVQLLDHLRQAPAVGGGRTGELVPELNERELQIVRLVADGASNRQIGDQLCLSENTVRTYLTEVLAKLGLENRVQLAMYALQHGLA
jgi:DNA-binding NarL/FixJ family response regulator